MTVINTILFCGCFSFDFASVSECKWNRAFYHNPKFQPEMYASFTKTNMKNRKTQQKYEQIKNDATCVLFMHNQSFSQTNEIN